MNHSTNMIRWLETLGRSDVALVGGKNASLGELISNLEASGIRVPGGFATTASAYQAFLEKNGLNAVLSEQMEALVSGHKPLHEVGLTVRRAMRHGKLPEALERQLEAAYATLCDRYQTPDLAVAVRSSATAEDLPEASFAGQQETYLNVRGIKDILQACRDCFASLFTDRAINYRIERGFDHEAVSLSVGIQKMVRSDLAGAGVMFSLDADTGFRDLVLISANFGVGETVVQGSVDPDEYRVFKPKLDRFDRSSPRSAVRKTKSSSTPRAAPLRRSSCPHLPGNGPSSSFAMTRSSPWRAGRWPSRRTMARRWTWSGRRMAKLENSTVSKLDPRRFMPSTRGQS